MFVSSILLSTVDLALLKGAIVEGPDANWFFKFTGPDETVKANTEQFRALLDSIQGPA